ncbi:MAG: hypothetical protein WAN35_02750 [Terracidiphilus sp.]
MKINPVEEWRRLTEHYRELSDGELWELEADFAGLTDTAQQVLRDEMKLRGLDRQRAASAESHPSARLEAHRWDLSSEAPQPVADSDREAEEDSPPREFTWKTVLCECDEKEEAWQIYEVLKKAGIDSWVEGPGTPFGRGLFNPRVIVAADQLEQAQEIAARPIPQEIIDEFNTPDEEYKPPVCPKCGAEDPTLENADPVNSWLCESCGAQWSDAPPASEESLKYS